MDLLGSHVKYTYIASIRCIYWKGKITWKKRYKRDNYIGKNITTKRRAAEIKCRKRKGKGVQAKASDAHLCMHMRICSQEDLYGTVIASRKIANYFPTNYNAWNIVYARFNAKASWLRLNLSVTDEKVSSSFPILIAKVRTLYYRYFN